MPPSVAGQGVPEPSNLTLARGDVIDIDAVLRDLPGKRRVYAGRLGGRKVIVKQYLDRQRGAVHAGRERKGLEVFRRSGIDAPAVLYAGDDAGGNPVIVLSRIDAALDLAQAWRQAPASRREELIVQMMELLARHHAAGVCQADLHLGNFLVGDGKFFSLDGADVSVASQALGEQASLHNLALFCSQFTPDWDATCIEASVHYAQGREWPTTVVSARLRDLIGQARWRRWRERAGKIYRECTAVVARRSADGRMFVMRSYGPVVRQWLDDIDAGCPADSAERLKDGNTATVWCSQVDGHALVIKRYNIKSRLHGIGLALKPRRASISWRFAHMLPLFGIATPAPVAFLLRGRSRFTMVGYFVAEDIGGISLRDWVGRYGEDIEQLRGMARQLAEMFAGLRRLRLAHGDMKASNLIVADNGRLYLIDLDSMRRHRWQALFERAWRRDMARFDANWGGQPEVLTILREEISALADI
jgi:tRNA A-37 threonylcarbamoyl transferase component Bud32